MKTTDSLKLLLPEQNDPYNIDDFNSNSQKIDAALGKKADIGEDKKILANQMLGETATTAYRGDRGKIAYEHSQGVADYVMESGTKPIPATGLSGITIDVQYTKWKSGLIELSGK